MVRLSDLADALPQNPGVDTTEQMQALNASMDHLTSHFNGSDKPSSFGHGMHGFPFSFAGANPFAHAHYDSDVEEWDEDEYEYESDDDGFDDYASFFGARGRGGPGRGGAGPGFCAFAPSPVLRSSHSL